LGGNIFCTGITGQDGSYLAELLLQQGYNVVGLVRRSSSENTGRISHLLDKVKLEPGDLTDSFQINKLIKELQPVEVYNLSAQSDVKASFAMPTLTTEVNAIGTLNVLEAIRCFAPQARFYQASTSELFGGINVPVKGFDETSSFYPRSPYAIAKLYAYWTTRMYRDAYNVFAANGIMFNHESPRRGKQFVTKKITSWCGKYWKYLHGGTAFPGMLELGNLESYRDWGHARDYVEAMTLILRHAIADDWVVSSGEAHSIREFVESCFRWMKIDLQWTGSGINEVGIAHDREIICINQDYFRPMEVDRLLGNSKKIVT
jgi:GDPmannose 4,6-dehydratase